MQSYKWTASRLNIFKIGLNRMASRNESQVQAPCRSIGYICVKKMLQVRKEGRTWCAVNMFIYMNIVRRRLELQLNECAQNILWKNALYVGQLNICISARIYSASNCLGKQEKSQQQKDTRYIMNVYMNIFWQIMELVAIKPGKWR